MRISPNEKSTNLIGIPQLYFFFSYFTKWHGFISLKPVILFLLLVDDSNSINLTLSL